MCHRLKPLALMWVPGFPQSARVDRHRAGGCDACDGGSTQVPKDLDEAVECVVASDWIHVRAPGVDAAPGCAEALFVVPGPAKVGERIARSAEAAGGRRVSMCD